MAAKSKPTITLRPRTRQLQAKSAVPPGISPELTDKLQALSKKSTVPVAITQAELERLSALPEDGLYRAKKKQISIRMDADVLAWYQAQPGKYQQLINKACRAYMRLYLNIL